MSERVARLTKRTVDGAAPASSRYALWDSELKGFGLRIETSGTKTYFVRYRPKGRGGGAPKRFLTLGRHGPLTPEQARARALAVLGSVANGEDPASVLAKSRAALTVSEAIQLFLAEHVRPKRKAGTAAYYEWLLTRTVVPKLGNLRPEQVTRAHLSKLHADLQQTPYQANRVLAVIGSLYAHLAKSGYVPEGFNPARGVEKYREQGRERYLTTEELTRLGAALREAETVGLPWNVGEGTLNSKHLAKPDNQRTIFEGTVTAAIRLLILTGARLREILHLRWDEVDLERGLAFLSDSKTGRKTLVLSAAALSVLGSLPRSGVFVIPGAKLNEPRSDLKKPWAAVQRRAKLEGVRLHDLRHTFASVGAGARLGLPIVGKLLGHSQPQTTARYAHLDADPLRQAANLIADQISASLDSSS
jgi:integrase